MLFRFSWFFALVGVLALACDGSDVPVDAGPPIADGARPEVELVLEGESALALAFGDRATVTARYLEDGVAVGGAEVRFVLEGRAHDSTIGALSSVTDADGYARTDIAAGTVPATFRLRVSATGASPLYVSVAVSNQGFGPLEVRATYEGRREGVRRRVVEVFTNLDCMPPGGLPDEPDLVQTLPAIGDAEARFLALPVGIPHAVVARVEGADGTVLARVCQDGITPIRDETTRVELAFVDRPLMPVGGYELTLGLDANPSAEAMRSGLDDAFATLRDEAGSDAALLLDALEAELRARELDALANAVAEDRAEPEVDEGLGADLLAAGEGPTESFSRRVESLASRLASLRFTGGLELRRGAMGTEVSFEPSWLILDASVDPPVRFAVETLPFALESSLVARWREHVDAIEVEELSAALPIETLAWLSIVEDATRAGLESTSSLFAEHLGCGVLETWVGERVDLVAQCDEACVAASCARVTSTLFDTLTVTLSELGSERRTIHLEGMWSVHDDNGDLIADRIEGSTFEGSWRNEAGEVTDPLRAELEALRRLE